MSNQVEVLHMEKRQAQAVAPGGLEREYKREMPQEKQPNVDSEKSHLNRYITTGPCLQVEDRPGTLHQRIQERIHDVQGDKTVRKDAVVDMEFILSGSHDTFEKMTPEQVEDWAMESYQFMAETFGEENIVEAVLHLDERTPHIHMHVVPIVTNKDGSQKLCAKELTTRGLLSKYHTDYAKRIERFGFERSSEGKGAKHRDPGEYYRDVQKRVAAEEKKLNTKAKIPEGKLPELSLGKMSNPLKENINRQQVFGGQQHRESIARNAAAEQREMDQQAVDRLSESYSHTLAGAEKKLEEKDAALKDMTRQRDSWYEVSSAQSQRLDGFLSREITADPDSENPIKKEVLNLGFSDSYLSAYYPRVFQDEIHLRKTVPWLTQFPIGRLVEVTKPNKPEPIDSEVRTIRGVPVNTGFLTCADSPETYRKKVDWTLLDDKERKSIIAKVFELLRNLSRKIADRLQQMLHLGKVNVKEAIRGTGPQTVPGQPLTKADEIKEATAITRERLQGLRL